MRRIDRLICSPVLKKGLSFHFSQSNYAKKVIEKLNKIGKTLPSFGKVSLNAMKAIKKYCQKLFFENFKF